MEIIGSLFLVLALAVLVVVFVVRPFFRQEYQPGTAVELVPESELEHRRSTLLAERDQTITALQELDFDYMLGKVPEEDYPTQRAVLVTKGAGVLRQLREIEPDGQEMTGSMEDRIEAAVAARRADAQIGKVQVVEAVAVGEPNGSQKSVGKDPLEDLIASRRRQREEKSAGFCPGCGKPVQKSDKFCSRCGTTL